MNEYKDDLSEFRIYLVVSKTYRIVPPFRLVQLEKFIE